MRASKIPSLVLGAAILASILACEGLTSTQIGKILDNPRQYAGKQVKVTGTVSEVFSLLVFKYFKVRDETGEIVVVSDKPMPKRGEKITVKGRVEEAFAMGDQQLIVLVEGEPGQRARE